MPVSTVYIDIFAFSDEAGFQKLSKTKIKNQSSQAQNKKIKLSHKQRWSSQESLRAAVTDNMHDNAAAHLTTKDGLQ